jgi:hypothetical protein
MKKVRITLYITITLALAVGMNNYVSAQPNPQNPPGTGPPGDPGGGDNPHNQVPFGGLELLVLAGGLLGFRKIKQLKDNH